MILLVALAHAEARGRAIYVKLNAHEIVFLDAPERGAVQVVPSSLVRGVLGRAGRVPAAFRDVTRAPVEELTLLLREGPHATTAASRAVDDTSLPSDMR
jgi:hypothetical protein